MLLESAGTVCNLRDIELGIAVGSAAKTAAIHSVDCRCQTRAAVAARKLGLIRADHAVALSLSVTHKAIGFDRRMLRRLRRPRLLQHRHAARRHRTRRTPRGRSPPPSTPATDHRPSRAGLIRQTRGCFRTRGQHEGRCVPKVPVWGTTYRPLRITASAMPAARRTALRERPSEGAEFQRAVSLPTWSLPRGADDQAAAEQPVVVDVYVKAGGREGIQILLPLE